MDAAPLGTRDHQGVAGLHAQRDALEQRDIALAQAHLVGHDARRRARLRPVGQGDLALHRLTLHVEVGKDAAEPLRHPPGAGAQQGQDGRHEGHAHDEGVDGYADGQAERDGLDVVVALGHERGEHREHDERRGGDHAGRADEAGLDGGARREVRVFVRVLGATVHVVLAHAGDEEHLVVHRQAEQHAHEHDRQEADDGADGRDVQEVGEPAPAEHRADGAEGGAHREEVAQGGLDRHPDRAEHDGQQHQREPDDEEAERDQGPGEAVRDVDRDGGEAGDLDVDAVLVEPAVVLRAQLAHELGRGRVVGRGGRDHLHDAGVGGLVRGGQGDGLDARDRGDVGGELVHEPERVGARDDRAGQDQRAVEADAEVLGGEVVVLARLALGRQHASVRQREADAADRDGGDAEACDHRDGGDDRMLRDEAHPAAGEADLGCGGRGGRGIHRARGACRTRCPHRGSPGPSRAARGTRGAADDAALDEAQERRGEGDRDEHGDRDRHGRGDAHRGEEGDVGEREPDEGDQHRDAGEDHGRAGGAGRAGGRLLELDAAAHLVLVARDDEQRVVDADREPEHEREQGCGGRDRREGRGEEDERHRQPHAEDRGEQGKPRDDERAEGDDEHEEGDDQADGLGDGDARHLLREEVAAEGDNAALGERRLQLLGDALELVVGQLGDRRGLAIELQAHDRGVAALRDEAVDHL